MLRKLDDHGYSWLHYTPCSHPEHDPPSMIVLEPGVYEHTCPGCGRSTVFSVNRATCFGRPEGWV